MKSFLLCAVFKPLVAHVDGFWPFFIIVEKSVVHWVIYLNGGQLLVVAMFWEVGADRYGFVEGDEDCGCFNLYHRTNKVPHDRLYGMDDSIREFFVGFFEGMNKQ